MNPKRIVIKLGTSSLTDGSDKLDQSKIIEIVRQCHEAITAGHQIIIVTSGSIAAGREILNYPDLPKTVASKQLLAAVGQGKLIRIWEQLFSIYHHNIGQVLLTRADMEDKERFLNAQDALKAMLSCHIIPVINENDVVATAEIKVGDNDNLSALAAVLTEADQLILLTDQEGLFTADPRSNPDAKLIQTVEIIDDQLKGIAGDSVSGLGTGGMSTKLQAAEIATRAGIEVIIASAQRKNVIIDIVNGQLIGTKFIAQEIPLEHRKHWLFAAPSSGKIHLDKGAAIAIRSEGCSILPKGITSVEGLFSRGDVIDVFDDSNHFIARGVSRYNSDAIKQIAGHHSQEIASLIGYEYGFVVIHRNDMILK